jgi:hypothetical protein
MTTAPVDITLPFPAPNDKGVFTPRRISNKEFGDEARRRFGPDRGSWRFICPVCKHEEPARSWMEVGHPSSAGFSCIGRWVRRRGCDYAGGGFFKLNPNIVLWDDGHEMQVMALAGVPHEYTAPPAHEEQA